MGVREAGGGDMRKFRGMKKYIPDYGDVFIGVFVSQLFRLLPFKHVQLIVCQLCFRKTVRMKENEQL